MLMYMNKQTNKSTSILPINENCALIFRVLNHYQKIPTSTFEQNHWSARLELLNLKSLQPIIGTELQIKDPSILNYNEHSAIKFFTFIAETDTPQDEDNKTSKHKPILNDSDALNVLAILNKHFNTDILKACKDYQNAINNETSQIKANAIVMQMAIDGQLILENEQIVDMAKQLGISTHLVPIDI